MGSAAAYHLPAAAGGWLGLDQFPPAHSRGSSHGHTRIIRTAYYEHPGYVPLVRRAFDLWFELEQLAGKPLLLPADCLGLGPPKGEVVTGVCQSAAVYNLAVETLTAAEVAVPRCRRRSSSASSSTRPGSSRRRVRDGPPRRGETIRC